MSSANKADSSGSNQAAASLGQYTNQFNSPAMSKLLQQYASGQTSLADLYKQAQGMVGQNPYSISPEGSAELNKYYKFTPEQMNSLWALGQESQDQSQAFMNRLATDPLTGTQFATDQVRSNPILGKLFGNGGELDNSIGTEQNLQNQGFQLTPQDREAYGQASGDIARQFGASENGLAQSLANRGLSSAPSGAAGAGFSGLQGNKNEMLAQAQLGIANARMNNTMQRIGQQQGFISQLGAQGANDIQQQYGRNQSGAETAYNQMTGNANTQNNNQALQQNTNNSQWAQDQATSFNPMSLLTNGVGSLVGGFTGQLGSNAADSLGSSGGSLFAPSSTTGIGDSKQANYGLNYGQGSGSSPKSYFGM